MRRIALLTVSYKTPKSLENSLKSWKAGGLLDLFDDLVMFLNAPTQVDRDLGTKYAPP